jgi:hypothetical protein
MKETMAFARMATIWIGAIALLVAFGLASWGGYLWMLTPCKAHTECARSASRFLMHSSVLVIAGTALMVLGRRLRESK